MPYNPEIHHRRSVRLQGYDYSREGLYFITICTLDKLCLFGEIVETQMVLNELGETVNKYWLEIPEHFPNAILHEFVIMPNHLHGIIELKSTNVGVQNFEPLRELQIPKINQYQKIIPRSIGSIVRGFKIGVTKWYRDKIKFVLENKMPKEGYLQISIYGNKIWQRNYHEHIIRNEQSYLTISNYIINNPLNWKEDRFYI
ncbi:transposase [Emticicia sp. C21]|uniref:transposase n=1 Tax=Emticicia sp. C21 TaxID=2302915 RepID=UPI000E34EE88|nr:transposase [Emticicia sp. C21]RFS15836.1 hypothetical protein D0T08_13085 [Emticicia sp. C21]